MDPSVYHAHLTRRTAERELLIISLEVIDSVNAFLVEYRQSLVASPPKADNSPLIPLIQISNDWNNVRVCEYILR